MAVKYPTLSHLRHDASRSKQYFFYIGNASVIVRKIHTFLQFVNLSEGEGATVL